MFPYEDIAWAFEYFYHMDKANACIHQASVKFSPITFALARFLELNNYITTETSEVGGHYGQYEMDRGR